MYRKLARQHHPDRNPGDAASEGRFKEIQAAYDLIDTSEKRRKFDEQKRISNMFGSGAGGDLGNFDFNFEGGGGIEDILASFFGGRGTNPYAGQSSGTIFDQGGRPRQSQQARPQRGANIDSPLDLTLEDAESGVKKPFTISSWEGGRLIQLVEVSYSTMMLGGKVRIHTPAGKMVEVDVPANSRSGDRRRLRGQGYNGGPLDVELTLSDSTTLTAEQEDALKALRDSGL